MWLVNSRFLSSRLDCSRSCNGLSVKVRTSVGVFADILGTQVVEFVSRALHVLVCVGQFDRACCNRIRLSVFPSGASRYRDRILESRVIVLSCNGVSGRGSLRRRRCWETLDCFVSFVASWFFGSVIGVGC